MAPRLYELILVCEYFIMKWKTGWRPGYHFSRGRVFSLIALRKIVDELK